jgi:membrane protein YdbS with pleckstrin-like domain
VSTSTEVRGGGVTFLGLLAIVFIALKLGGILTWSWWAILAPLWLPWALAIVIVGVVLLLGAIE